MCRLSTNLGPNFRTLSRVSWLCRLLIVGSILGCGRSPGPGERAAELSSRASAEFAKQTEATSRAAIALWEQAFAAWETLGDVAHQAEVAGSIGEVWDNLGDMTRARDWSLRAVELYRKAGDRHFEAEALCWTGVAEVHLGDYESAIARFEQARDLAKGYSDRAYAHALLDLGFVWQRKDAHARAAEYLGQARVIYERLGDTVQLGAVHNNLGYHYFLIGDAMRAELHHRHALVLRIANRLLLDQGWSWVNLGGVYLELGNDPERGLEAYERAIALWTAVGNRVGLPLAIDGRGRALRRLGRLDDARAAFTQAIEGYRSTNAPRGIAESSNNLGEVLAQLDRTAEARAAFTTAYDLAEPRPSDRARALVGLAQLDRTADDLAAARTRADEAVALLDGVRGNIIRDVQRASWVATVSGAYDLVVELALVAGDVERAFVAAERMRARTLVEALARAGHGGTESFLAGVASSSASLGPLSLVDQARSFLDDATALVLVRLGDRGSQAFVVRAKQAAQVVELPPRASIEAVALATYTSLSRASGVATVDELSAMIARPIARATLGAKRIVIVPDGGLHFLPFELMPDLADRELAYLPSLSTLPALRKHGRVAPVMELAVVADPLYAPDDARITTPHPPVTGPTLARLHWSKLEAEQVAATVPETRRVLLLGPDATVDKLRSAEVANARVVHIATHATADAMLPERSALQLSSVDATGRPIEGALPLAQIPSLRLRAELVVLSGCHTAGGALFRGEGIVGLTGGFLTAGARQVVASLWQVDDRATAELMGRFHAARAKGETTHAALDRARAAIRADPRWRAPYYWAAFVVYGDWRDDRGAEASRADRR